MPTSLSLIGTIAWKGEKLRRRCLTAKAWIAYALLTALMAGVSIATSDPYPALLWLSVLFFLLHALSLYIREQCFDDAVSLRGDATIASMLESALIRGAHDGSFSDTGELVATAFQTERGRFIIGVTDMRLEDVCAACKDPSAQFPPISDFLLSIKDVCLREETRITATAIIRSACTAPTLRALLDNANISTEDLNSIIHWEMIRRHRTLSRGERLLRMMTDGGIARSWVMGYTDALDSITREIRLQESATNRAPLHTDELATVLDALATKSGRNILLLGRRGSGKRSFALRALQQLRAYEQRHSLAFTRSVELNVELLLTMNDPEKFLYAALAKSTHAGSFIFLIPKLGLFLQSASATLRSVLLSFVDRKTVSVIGLLEPHEYHTLVKTTSALDSAFRAIVLGDVTDAQVLDALQTTMPMDEGNIGASYKALSSIVLLSRRYLSGSGAMPGIAVELLRASRAAAAQAGSRRMEEEHVRAAVSAMAKIDVRAVTEDERVRLLSLEERMQQRVIGQPDGIHAVVAALKRARIDIAGRQRPIGTYLFLGPTGVGKTQTAKVLAEEYFGSSAAMIRVDMNEYARADGADKLIGLNDPTGSALTRAVQDRPFSVILLDEIEKAHPSILNLFLQVLDEGVMSTGDGSTIDFRNAIIIATSNAGALFLREALSSPHPPAKEELRRQLIDHVLQQHIFSPEFLNRFDATVLFTPLTVDDAMKVAGQMIGDIVHDVHQRRGIAVILSDEAVSALTRKGYSLEFGAREMRRTVTGILEDYLADYMLRHEVKRGEEIKIGKEELGLGA